MSIEPDDSANQPLFDSTNKHVAPDTEFITPDYEESSSNAGPSRPQQPQVSGQMDNPSSANDPPSYRKSHSIFSFNYYMNFFNVDTRDVMERCLLALNPFNKDMFLLDEDEVMERGQGVTEGYGHIAGGRTSRPDMYGPFWICTTVVLVLFFSSTLVGILFSSWHGVKYEYKFELLTGAAGLMYSYTFILPLVLWLALRYLNIAPSTTLMQLVSLYGYSNVTWIPVAVLSVSPLLGAPNVSNIIRWVFIALGFGLSCSFIGKNIYRKLLPEHNSSADTRKKAITILALCVVLHIALAFAVKILFFGGVVVEDEK